MVAYPLLEGPEADQPSVNLRSSRLWLYVKDVTDVPSLLVVVFLLRVNLPMGRLGRRIRTGADRCEAITERAGSNMALTLLPLL